MNFNKPFTYDPQKGIWSLELQKTPKDTYSQCGIKISINTGFPTAETGACYQSKEPCGLSGSWVEIRFFDILSGWTSVVNFDLPTLLQKLVEIMPKDKVKFDTFLLAQRDIENLNKIKKI